MKLKYKAKPQVTSLGVGGLNSEVVLSSGWSLREVQL